MNPSRPLHIALSLASSLALLGLVGLAAAATTPAHAQSAPDVATLLRDADRARMTTDNLQVDTLVQTFKADGSPDKERRYTVFAQSGRRSLVLMQSPAEKGQKVLMLGDDFWLLMPSSQRPLRITPMQKLLGDASTGDIATLSWSSDYTGTLAGEGVCPPGSDPKSQEKSASSALSESARCYQISMTAARKGVTYQRIELWVGHTHHEPVRADLYVQSDKLAKQARFVLDKPGSRDAQVTDMLLTDQLGNGKQTRVSYLARQPRTVPAEWLNPMFLAHNPALEAQP
jgi:hypothetical protein